MWNNQWSNQRELQEDLEEWEKFRCGEQEGKFQAYLCSEKLADDSGWKCTVLKVGLILVLLSMPFFWDLEEFLTMNQIGDLAQR